MRRQIKNAAENAWAETLQEILPELPVYAGRRREVIEPPYVVALVREVEELVHNGNVWEAEVRVLLVTDLDEVESVIHDELAEALDQAIRAVPQPSYCAEEQVLMCGYAIHGVGEAEDREESVFADVWRIRAGFQRKVD